jgi:hypothetical protein
VARPRVQATLERPDGVKPQTPPATLARERPSPSSLDGLRTQPRRGHGITDISPPPTAAATGARRTSHVGTSDHSPLAPACQVVIDMGSVGAPAQCHVRGCCWWWWAAVDSVWAASTRPRGTVTSRAPEALERTPPEGGEARAVVPPPRTHYARTWCGNERDEAYEEHVRRRLPPANVYIDNTKLVTILRITSALPVLSSESSGLDCPDAARARSAHIAADLECGDRCHPMERLAAEVREYRARGLMVRWEPWMETRGGAGGRLQPSRAYEALHPPQTLKEVPKAHPVEHGAVVLIVPLRDRAGRRWEEAWSFERFYLADQSAVWRGLRSDLQLESGEPMYGAMSRFLANRRITSVCESLVRLDGAWLRHVPLSFIMVNASKVSQYNMATHHGQHYAASFIESVELPGCHQPLPAERIAELGEAVHTTLAATSSRSSAPVPSTSTTPRPSLEVSAGHGVAGDHINRQAAAAPPAGGNETTATVLTSIRSFFAGLFAARPAPTRPRAVPIVALRVAVRPSASASQPHRAGPVRAVRDVEVVDVADVGAGASSGVSIFRTTPLHAHALASAAAHPGGRL